MPGFVPAALFDQPAIALGVDERQPIAALILRELEWRLAHAFIERLLV